MKKAQLLVLSAFLLTGCGVIPPTSQTSSSSLTSSSEDVSSSSEGSSSTTSSSESSSQASSETTSENSSETTSGTSSELTSEPPVNEFPDVEQVANPHIVNTEDYYKFWSPTTKLDFKLEISPTNLKRVSDHGKVKNDKKNDLYFPGKLTVTIDGTPHVFDEVGIRQKGNTSRGEMTDNDGKVIYARGFKITFNETWDDAVYQEFPDIYKTWTEADPAYLERDDRTLFGMKKLDFKWNKSNDQTMVFQPFIFNFFRHHNAIAPHSTLTSFSFENSTHGTVSLGVLTINEPIDKTLLRRTFSKADAKGDLYKATYNIDGPATLKRDRALKYSAETGGYVVDTKYISVEDTFGEYHPIYDLKTNDKPGESTHAGLVSLINTLEEIKGKSEAERITGIETVVDIDAFIDYAALAYLTGNPDDLRNNGNNYYMYFQPTKGNKAYFIPYDYDWALGLMWDAVEYPEGGKYYMRHKQMLGAGNKDQEVPLFLYTITNVDTSGYGRIDTYKDQYTNRVKELINDKYFSTEYFNKLYNAYYTSYKDVMSTFDTYTHWNGTQKFQDYINFVTPFVNNYN